MPHPRQLSSAIALLLATAVAVHATEGLITKPSARPALVFGNPRLGTPVFVKHSTLAIDLPLKAPVWEDPSGKVF